MIKQEDIIKPLIFLDIFDYPPTAMELWRFLGVKAELGEIVPLLFKEGIGVVVDESRNFKNSVPEIIFQNHPPTPPWKGGESDHPPTPPWKGGESDHPPTPPWKGGESTGFYFLPGRNDLIEKRREFVYLSEKKFKIAKRAAWLLHFIPSIKMIAVCNNFYYRPQSDIDFFIITKKNRLWLTRFFATIILDLFRLRARGRKTADRICLSFYLSDDNLNLEKIALRADDEKREARDCFVAVAPRNDKIDDPYLSYWLAFLEPIYGERCYNEFWQANSWIKNIFPNAEAKRLVARRRAGNDLTTLSGTTPTPPWKGGGFLGKEEGALGDWLEKSVKKIQWKKISPRVKERAALGDTRVAINDAMLKFHENDRREEFRDKLKIKIEKLKIE